MCVAPGSASLQRKQDEDLNNTGMDKLNLSIVIMSWAIRAIVYGGRFVHCTKAPGR